MRDEWPVYWKDTNMLIPSHLLILTRCGSLFSAHYMLSLFYFCLHTIPLCCIQQLLEIVKNASDSNHLFLNVLKYMYILASNNIEIGIHIFKSIVI